MLKLQFGQSWEVDNCMSIHGKVSQVVAPIPTELATFHPPVGHQIVEQDHAVYAGNRDNLGRLWE